MSQQEYNDLNNRRNELIAKGKHLTDDEEKELSAISQKFKEYWNSKMKKT